MSRSRAISILRPRLCLRGNIGLEKDDVDEELLRITFIRTPEKRLRRLRNIARRASIEDRSLKRGIRVIPALETERRRSHLRYIHKECSSEYLQHGGKERSIVSWVSKKKDWKTKPPENPPDRPYANFLSWGSKKTKEEGLKSLPKS